MLKTGDRVIFKKRRPFGSVWKIHNINANEDKAVLLSVADEEDPPRIMKLSDLQYEYGQGNIEIVNKPGSLGGHSKPTGPYGF